MFQAGCSDVHLVNKRKTGIFFAFPAHFNQKNIRIKLSSSFLGYACYIVITHQDFAKFGECRPKSFWHCVCIGLKLSQLGNTLLHTLTKQIPLLSAKIAEKICGAWKDKVKSINLYETSYLFIYLLFICLYMKKIMIATS